MWDLYLRPRYFQMWKTCPKPWNSKKRINCNIEALRARQRRYQNQKHHQIEVSGLPRVLSWLSFIKTLEGRELRQKCIEVWPQTEMHVKENLNSNPFLKKPVQFPGVLVQDKLWVGVTCQWPQPAYCIWSHISNLDSQHLLASRSGSWTSHQIQSLCHLFT